MRHHEQQQNQDMTYSLVRHHEQKQNQDRTYSLVRHHEQQQNKDKNHLEFKFGRNDVFINYDSEHEQHNSLLEHHSDPSFDEHASGHHHNDIACSKRTKLLQRLKRWVDGSEKPRVRHSISKGHLYIVT